MGIKKKSTYLGGGLFLARQIFPEKLISPEQKKIKAVLPILFLSIDLFSIFFHPN